MYLFAGIIRLCVKSVALKKSVYTSMPLASAKAPPSSSRMFQGSRFCTTSQFSREVAGDCTSSLPCSDSEYKRSTGDRYHIKVMLPCTFGKTMCLFLVYMNCQLFKLLKFKTTFWTVGSKWSSVSIPLYTVPPYKNLVTKKIVR